MYATRFLLIVTLLAVTACSGTGRPTYSGRQESTEGVPGFVDGKKTSPYVKLGQSYTIDGKTYVPRYQPDYVEEGLASWYGPGFHGGKTANGEAFDKHAMTAAHRTLPLPSIVRVTHLRTGKQAYVRVNDRGPFSKGRIIDLSYAAAKEVGIIGKGVDRVRVEYMPHESQRFADLMSQGRDPQSIEMAEVISRSGTQYARVDVPRARPVDNATYTAASVDAVMAEDIPAPAAPVVAAPAAAPAPIVVAAATPAASPFSALEVDAGEDAPAAAHDDEDVVQESPVVQQLGKHFIQLGAFLQQANADRLRMKAAKLGPVRIESKPNAEDSMLYIVRMGPYENVDESTRVLAQLDGLGVSPKIVSE